MTSRILLQPITNGLPEDISALQSDAANEGYRFIERLIDEWETGDVRFDEPDEALLIARCDGTIAGIGGVTIDPFDQTALRMRRFYIRQSFRRHGIAKKLAAALMEDALKTGRALNVNAGTEAAPPFWERMGFKSAESQHHTHFWPTAKQMASDRAPQ